MLKYLLATAITVLVIVLGAYIDQQSQTTASRPTRSAVSYSIFAPGLIEGKTEEIELRSRLTGRIHEILVEEGQNVSEGDPLLRIDDQQYRYERDLAAARLALAEAEFKRLLNGAHLEQRKEAEAEYRARQADLKKYQQDYMRKEKLYKTNAVTEEEFERLRAQLESAQATLDAAKSRRDLVNAPAREDEVEMAKAKIAQARSNLDLADVQLARATIVAPSDGRILDILVEPGELIGPESRLPAIVMADTAQYRVRAFVEELDAPRVQIGMAASVTADGWRDRVITGTIIRLSPRMDRKRLTTDDPAEHFDTKVREVWIELENSDDLVVGLRVDVTIDPELPNT